MTFEVLAVMSVPSAAEVGSGRGDGCTYGRLVKDAEAGMSPTDDTGNGTEKRGLRQATWERGM
jgi:hypothetical protein